MNNFLNTNNKNNATNVALFLLRFVFGLFMMTHGYDKLHHFEKMVEGFPDPLHLTSRISLIATIFAELICSTCVVLGIFTRYTALPVIFCMFIAAAIINGGKPLLEHELAPLYLTAFTVIALLGPGRLSVDSVLFKKNRT